MLRRSFVHLPGIGPSRERNLWDRGVETWDELEATAIQTFKERKGAAIIEALELSRRAYESRDYHYFYKAFPRDALWRLVPECLERTAYFDIESTGLGLPPMSRSTTITFYYRGNVYQEFDHDRKRELIEWILKDSLMLCSFFGEGFDVPFLQAEFGIPFQKAHLDLCFWLKRLGFKGGLKKIQKLFPDIPERASMDIDGYDAVKLWRMHERGVRGALETLLTYNAEDTVVLEPLLVKAYNLEIAKHPFLDLAPLTQKPLPELHTQVHAEIYSMLRRPPVEQASLVHQI